MGDRQIEEKAMRVHYETHREEYTAAVNVEQIFKSSSMLDDFNPAIMKLPREACDSIYSPRSRGYIFGNDFSGSMGRYSADLVKDVFPELIRRLYKTTSCNPHIMFMGICDAEVGDAAPLQVTQFETDLRMLEQLKQLWIPRNAGGNNEYESYILAWYFAAKHIEMDCFNKRGEKGFLFTFGDEEPTPKLYKRDINTVFGGRDTIERPFLTATDCLDMASEKFHCYHIILHGNYYDHYPSSVISGWRNLMEGHVCDLSDYTCLPHLVATINRMHEGISKTVALEELEGHHAKIVVEDALKWHEEVVVPETDTRPDAKIEEF